MTIETSKTEKQREKWLKKPPEHLRIWDDYKRCNVCVTGVPNVEERNRSIFEETNMEYFPQIIVRHQNKDAGNSENIKQDKCKIKLLGISYSKFRKSMIISEKVRRKISPYLWKKKARAIITLGLSISHASKKRMDWNVYSVESKKKHQPGILHLLKLSFKS